MVFISNLQKETLLKVDEMINENKTFEEISNYLYKNDYMFRVEVKNGYASKTKFEIVKMIKDENGKSCFRVSVRRPVRISAATPSCLLDSIRSTLSSI